MVKAECLENTFPTLVPLVTAFQESHHPDSSAPLLGSIPLAALRARWACPAATPGSADY